MGCIKYVSDFLGRNIWNHTSWMSLGRGDSSTPSIGRLCRTRAATSFYTANFDYCGSHECCRLIVDIGSLMIYLVDLGTYYRSQGYWRIKDRTWNCVRSLSCCGCVWVRVQLFCFPCNPLIPRYGFFIVTYLPLLYGSGLLVFTRV